MLKMLASACVVAATLLASQAAQAADPEGFYRKTHLPAKLARSLEGLNRSSPLFDLRLVLGTIRSSLTTNGGVSDHRNAGEGSAPSQVCFLGIMSPFLKAGLVSEKAIACPPPADRAVHTMMIPIQPLVIGRKLRPLTRRIKP